MKDIKLFGTDGIRGTAGKYPLDANTVKIIGVSAAKAFSNKKRKALFVIGRDTRQSGPSITKNLAYALSSCGAEVWDLGVIPTPGVAFIARNYPVSAAAVISASHNPYQDNGIKFFSHKGTKLPDKLEARIEKFIKRGVSAAKPSKPKNIKRKPLMVEEYKTFLRNSFSRSASINGMKLVIDCANGATSALANEIFSGLGAIIIPINCSPNGININKDCGSLHPDKLKQEVLRNKAYCGLAFDGDGDRINFVDENGIVRDGDYLLAIASLHLKEKGLLKNDLLVTTVMANLGLYRAMEKLGIKTRQTPVGDRYVFEEMVRSGAVIGGEQSGHIIFTDYLPTGDGMLSALQILGVAAEKGVPFSRLCSIIEKYPQVLINTKVSRKVPVEKLPETSALIKKAEKILGKEGRILVRYSGTENLIRVMIEGRDKKEINEMAQNISETAKREIDK